jgi:hypothetical protein
VLTLVAAGNHGLLAGAALALVSLASGVVLVVREREGCRQDVVTEESERLSASLMLFVSRSGSSELRWLVVRREGALAGLELGSGSILGLLPLKSQISLSESDASQRLLLRPKN